MDILKFSSHVTKPLQMPMLLSSCIFKIKQVSNLKANMEKPKRDTYTWLGYIYIYCVVGLFCMIIPQSNNKLIKIYIYI